MKHLLSLLLTLLLLCGCAQETSSVKTEGSVGETIPASEPAVPDSSGAVEEKYGGSLRIHPLRIRKAYGMRAMNDSLLVFSGHGSTTLTLLIGENLQETASITLDFTLEQDDPSLRIGDGEISYFDPVTRETVVLDSSLREVSHIAAPGDLIGQPILSEDRNTLYYCTSTAIRAWDLETGLHRCVKEMAFDSQTLTGLHLNDTVLQCRILDSDRERTLFLSTDTGQILYEYDGTLTLHSNGSNYFASIPAGSIRLPVFCVDGYAARTLTPANVTAQHFFLEQQNAAVTVSVTSEEKTLLEYYELDTGLRRSALTEEFWFTPSAVADTGTDAVYLLIYDPEQDCDKICRWDVGAQSSLILQDKTDYTGSYYTAEHPDWHGIVQCQFYAEKIGRKHGIEILVWEDALAVEPWDYDLEAEYLVPVIQRELELLDQRLAQFPEGFLAATASPFTSLKICLVRQITGTAESGSLDTATGVQFLEGTDAYVVLSIGADSERTLYHELFHVMETHIFNESIAFDQWNSLNPAGFKYDYDYEANAQRNSGIYLLDESRAFIDTYSMSFPKEDRARILEYAILPGNESLFQSEIMQAKLTRLCEGIREAYGLKKSPETFPWEQYLEKSLAYTK